VPLLAQQASFELGEVVDGSSKIGRESIFVGGRMESLGGFKKEPGVKVDDRVTI
jgi:hypothetical protein